MITKGIVYSQVEGTNLFKVRIPIFDGIEGSSTSTDNDLLASATLCTLPNVDNVVSPGDIVYVGFENNDIGKPVILGQLYQKPSKTNTCIDITLRSLVVEDKKNKQVSLAKLPSDTTIGSTKFSDIQKLIFYFNNMYNH